MPYNDKQGTLKILKRAYAEKTRRTIFFVGAGASAEAGLPTWYDLREEAHKAINQVVDSAASEEVLENFRELEMRRSNNDYWGYFEFAEKHWGTTYNDVINQKLEEPISKAPLPVVYEKLWSMRNNRQIATLNVDGLIQKSFLITARTRSATLLNYDGFAITDSQAFLAKDAFCCLNLHGTIYQKSRWVMNGSERRKLTEGSSGDKYKAFLKWLFQTHNIVFVGVNPEDIAISPAINAAKESGILGEHFWICPTPNSDTRAWAEKSGVRLVTYSPKTLDDGTVAHSMEICSILDDIEHYSAPEPKVDLPIKRGSIDVSEVPETSDLVNLIYNDRPRAIEILSQAANWIGEKYGFDSGSMSQFIRTNSLAIQIATSLDSKVPNHDSIGQYKLHEKLQGSGSSSVWLAEDTTRKGNYLVAKIMNGNVHEDETERMSFRRGIQSMYLLNSSNSSVAPQYIDHFELPLAVIMEHVTGSPLSTAVTTGEFAEPSDILNIFLVIARAVRICHVSDGQILHRDLKPGNIIFEGWYPGYEKSQLLEARARLINFDLSWHRYSSGNTKAISAEESGYYAPEQKGLRNTAPPRSASTDVYMLGMILYYLISSDHPPEGGARLVDWSDQVKHAVKRKFKNTIVANRIARLIEMMTLPAMNDRIDIEASQAEVESLLHFMSGSYQQVDHDMFVENLIFESGREYDWNYDRIEGRIITSHQADFRIRYLSRGMKAEIEFSRSRTEADARASFGQKINQKMQESSQSLKDAGWECEISSGTIKVLKANIKISSLVAKKDLGASEILNISNRLLANFD